MRFALSAGLAVALLLSAVSPAIAKAVAGKAPRAAAPAAAAPTAAEQPPPSDISAAPPVALTTPDSSPIPIAPSSAFPAQPAANPEPATAAADEEPVPENLLIRTGNHGTFARVAFECPQMTNYRITATGNILHVTLDTKAAARISVGKTTQIKKIVAIPGDETLTVDITTSAGTTYKDFRFKNRIVLDVFSAAAKMPPAENKSAAAKVPEKNEAPVKATAKATEPKISTEKAPPEKKPAAIPAAKPEPVPPAKADTTAPIQITPSKPEPPKAAAVPVAPVDTAPVLFDPQAIASAKLPGEKGSALPTWNLPITQPDGGVKATQETQSAQPSSTAEEEPEATLTLSSLSPMRLAAFQRFGTLWIVTDATGTSASLPSVSGKMANFIAPGKVLRFKQGTAYSYTLPQKFYPRVTKQKLSWQVDLLTHPPAPADAFLSAEMHVQSDPKTKETMLVSFIKGAGEPLSFDDPAVGDKLYVVPTLLPHQAIQEERRMIDLEVIPAAAGIVIRPLKDDIKMRRIALSSEPVAAEEAKEKAPASHDASHTENKDTKEAVVVTALSGLSITPSGGAIALISQAEEVADDINNRLFDFPNWGRGGPEKMPENRQKIQTQIAAATTPDERAGLLMDMAKLYFANNFGQETLGVLDLVLIENPEIIKNPDFVALRGAANAMSGHYKEALQDLSMPAIQQHQEMGLWIGYAAAATEQWHMANRSFPKSNRLLLQYPDSIAIPFTVYMAESALHLGHTDTANKLLASISRTSDSLDPQYKAAIDYLRGISYAQMGEPKKAIALWQPVADGLDRLYHAKASLSLVRLLLQEKQITLKEAIDRVDSLRFAWRGDGLEVIILHTLGALKVQDGQILSGLGDMKRAATMADSLNDDATPIQDDMKRVFTDLFLSDPGNRIKPLEMVSVYNEFNSLIPPGPEATMAALNFADSLIRMDLLAKAAEIMESQLKSSGLPEDKLSALGTKLTAVYLLDSKPKQALAALQETERANLSPRLREERTLLKARAQSQLGQTGDAIATLSALDSKNAHRLRADVLWRAQKWADAAAATEALLPDGTKPLSEEEASYVMSAAVASKLDGDMVKLKEIKTKYGAVMAATKLSSTFEVVTRESASSALSDRETMLRIAGEVDMFKGFLDNYKAGLGSGG